MDTALVALDWGTSNCRAFRVAEDGQIIASRAAAQGILSVANNDFAGAFRNIVSEWQEGRGAPVLMSGMIGSRQGWVEAPYAPTPAGADELAKKLAPVPLPGRKAFIVPGIDGPMAAGGRDVMRGEETQIIGALDLDQGGRASRVMCLPGTHSKWVEVAGGRIQRFATFMTGEVFAVLKQHSILGRLMTGTAHDNDAFAAGLARSERAGGLLHQLFGVRTEGLFGTVKPEGLSDFMSGLLIGHEVRAALEWRPSENVTLVGTPELCALYRAALARQKVSATQVGGEAAAVRGLWRLAQRAGLIGS
jgi:2-dehydro-3-deoxygalactonokinase